MMRYELAYRWILYAAATLLVVILQSLILNHISIWGVHPFLPPVLVAITTSLEGRGQAIGYAGVFGLLCDLSMQAPIPCFYTLTFVLITLVTSLIAKKIIMPGFFCSIIVASVGIFVVDLLDTACLAYGNGVTFSSGMNLAGREILISLILVPLVHLLLLKIHRKTAVD